jgi:glycosyltransferase involved in cell wall biosynthesis
MTPAIRLGLVLNTFNQPDYLSRVLQGLSEQTSMPDEVVLADDGSDDRTRQVFRGWTKELSLRTEHIWQAHEGFRRARILNEAIARTQSEYLVFLDGDTVPHPEFVADHRRLALPGTFVQGHRALLKEQAAARFGLGNFWQDRRRSFWSGQLEGLKQAFRWPRPWVRRRTDLRGVRGCNLATWRDDLVKVNGYNEAFVGWGREDSELAARLMNVGVTRRDARGWALCYHLWHAPASRTALAVNDDLLAEATIKQLTRCQKGLDGHSH